MSTRFDTIPLDLMHLRIYPNLNVKKTMRWRDDYLNHFNMGIYGRVQDKVQ